MVLETKTAVKTLAINPITRVTAKPFTGPVPNKKRNAHETTVVTCVSMMVRNALLKPASTAAITALPARSSSRSEEHTSELQSQSNLVCRLLLEKKKKKKITTFEKNKKKI